MHVCRSIHANPVKDGLVKNLTDWPYSNYLEWIGCRPGTLVDREFISTHFANTADYAEFVEDYLDTRQLPDGLSYLEN